MNSSPNIIVTINSCSTTQLQDGNMTDCNDLIPESSIYQTKSIFTRPTFIDWSLTCCLGYCCLLIAYVPSEYEKNERWLVKKKKPKIKELKIFFFFFFQNGNEIRSKRKRERGGRKGSERNKWNQKEIDSVYYIFHHCDLSTRLNVNWSAQQFDKCAFIYLVFVSLQTDIQPIKYSMFTFIDVCASASIKNWSNSPLFSRSKFMSNLWISNHQLEPMTKWWNFPSL